MERFALRNKRLSSMRQLNSQCASNSSCKAHFVSQSEADQLARIVATPQRSLNPQIVGKSVEFIANMAGISVPSGTRCLLADVGGVGRDFPLSMEKLSPILAFYVEDGIERGADGRRRPGLLHRP